MRENNFYSWFKFFGITFEKIMYFLLKSDKGESSVKKSETDYF